MSNAVLTIHAGVDRFLQLLGLRSQRQLGVVYDSVTKQPVDPVVVKLIDAKTSKTIATNIANLHGEYGFMADPGTYRMYVQRPHYKFPSERVTSLRDGIYYPVYHGEDFQFVGGNDVISLSVPLDPTAPDWNQEAKKTTIRTYPILRHVVTRVIQVLFWCALLLAIIGYIDTRSRAWLAVLCVYALVLLLALFVPRVRLWGRVRLANGIPVAGAEVTVSHAKLPDIVIAKAVTVQGGKFFIRLGPGKYIATVSMPTTESHPRVTKSFVVRVGQAGVVNTDFLL